MRKFLLTIIALTAMVSAFVSCGGRHKVSSINLPDSAQVGKILPEIIGTIDEYYVVEPRSYTLLLGDSVPSITLSFILFNPCQGDEYSVPVIKNDQEGGLASTAYVTLLDSAGTELTFDGLCFVANDTETHLLSEGLTSDEGRRVDVTFYCNKEITPEQYDSIVQLARNFRLTAEVSYEIDSAKIDADLQKMESAHAQAVRWVNDFNASVYSMAGRAACMKKINYYNGILSNYGSKLKKLSDEGKLTPEQEQRLNKMRSR